jgi:WD40 repeat protein
MLQQGLQQFARPWNQLRAVRVFRDKTGLTATPALWNSIVSSLDSSEYFLLLASPQAAQSQWVNQEVRHWLSQPRAERLLIVLTEGEIVWDQQAGRLDTERTNALPEAFQKFSEEPLWLDLRWARYSDQVSLQNPMFREIVADLSSVLRGIPKDQLIGEDVRQHRRATALRRAAITGLTILTLGLAGTAYVALEQRNLAQEQARIALGRQMAAQSELIRASQPERFPLALLMAAEAVRSDPTSSEAQQTLQALLSQFPEPAGSLNAGSGNVKVAVDPQFKLVATSTKDGGALWRLPDRMRIATLPSVNQLVISADGTTVAGCCSPVEVWDSNGVRKMSVDSAALSGGPVNIALTSDGKRLAIGFEGRRGPGFAVWDVDAGQSLFRREIDLSGNAPSLAFAPNGDLAVTMRTTIELLRSGSTEITALVNGTDGLVTLAYSPDGRYLAWSTTSSISVYDFTKGAEVAQLKASSGDSPGGGVDRLFFSADSEYLGGVGDVNTSTVWRAPNWREVLAPRHGEFRKINTMAFDPATPQVVTCDANGYCLGWSLETRQNTYRFAHQYAFEGTAAQPQILDATFAPAGSMLLTSGADGTVRLWNVTPPAEAGRVPCDGEPIIRTFTPAGRRWSTAGGFVPETCSPRFNNPDDAGRGAITDPDSNYSASVAGIDVVRVRKRGDDAAIAELVHADPIDWDAVQARLIKGGMTSQRAYLPEIARMKDRGSLHIEALSSSGKYVITTRDADEMLRVWDTATREVVMKEEISNKALVLDFLTDTQFVRAESEGSLSVVDVVSRAAVWSGPLGSLEALTASGDRKLLAWADETEGKFAVHVRETASGRALLDRPLAESADSIHVNHDNEFIAVTIGDSTMVPEGLPLGVGLHVWRVADGQEVVSIDESDKVIAFNFAPNAPSLAVVTRDGSVRVWDLRSGRVMNSVVSNPGPVAFGESGKWLAVGNTSVQVLDATSLKAVAQLTFANKARRLDFMEGDRVLAASTFRDGDGRGTSYRRYWQLTDVMTETCKRLPLTSAKAQWKQLLGSQQLPSPCNASR